MPTFAAFFGLPNNGPATVFSVLGPPRVGPLGALEGDPTLGGPSTGSTGTVVWWAIIREPRRECHKGTLPTTFPQPLLGTANI